MGRTPDSGGDPQLLGQCTACGEVYPVQRDERGALRPIGVAGGCSCGNDEFDPCADAAEGT